MNKPQRKVSLIFCILMDALGYATYALPLLGEFADLVWAPISAFIFYRTFGTWKGTMFNFIEEILPGFDFIPTFTLMWLWQASRRMTGQVNPKRSGQYPANRVFSQAITKR